MCVSIWLNVAGRQCFNSKMDDMSGSIVAALVYISESILSFKSLGSLRNVLAFERKAHFLSIKIIDQKYSVDIVNVVNDYWCLETTDF